MKDVKHFTGPSLQRVRLFLMPAFWHFPLLRPSAVDAFNLHKKVNLSIPIYTNTFVTILKRAWYYYKLSLTLRDFFMSRKMKYFIMFSVFIHAALVTLLCRRLGSDQIVW